MSDWRRARRFRCRASIPERTSSCRRPMVPDGDGFAAMEFHADAVEDPWFASSRSHHRVGKSARDLNSERHRKHLIFPRRMKPNARAVSRPAAGVATHAASGCQASERLSPIESARWAMEFIFESPATRSIARLVAVRRRRPRQIPDQCPAAFNGPPRRRVSI